MAAVAGSLENTRATVGGEWWVLPFGFRAQRYSTAAAVLLPLLLPLLLLLLLLLLLPRCCR